MRLLNLVAVLVAGCSVAGCSSAPPLPKMGAAVPPAQVAAIKAMPYGPTQTEVIGALIASTAPAATLKYDAFAAHKRADSAATTAHFQGHIVVLQDARVERGWSAKEDASGMVTAQVKSTDGMVSEGLRFARTDEARIVALKPEARITATCLLLNGIEGYVPDAIVAVGCTLSN